MTDRQQREFRLTYHQTGLWGTSSAYYFHAVDLVFQESKKVGDGVSRWAYAGLPILMAGVEAVLIEHQHMLRDNSADTVVAGVDPIQKVLNQYPLPDELRRDIFALIEIRPGYPSGACAIRKARVARVRPALTRSEGTRRQHAAEWRRCFGAAGESQAV